MHWPLAKVIRLIPGKDGKITAVELKTRSGTMLRPIQRAYPFEESWRIEHEPDVERHVYALLSKWKRLRPKQLQEPKCSKKLPDDWAYHHHLSAIFFVESLPVQIAIVP
ncbi:hypothetical protein TNCV_959661 [Trichonephila clavipes]|nr:hypothetical protein TNCV_959661 [Trichonephila clavipes]